MHAEARLRTWLQPNRRSVRDAQFRAMFDLGASEVSPACRDAMTFVLAVLRDIYPDDDDVRRWLTARRHAFDGANAIERLARGDHAVVTDAVVHAWQQLWRLESREDTIEVALIPTR